MIVNLLICAPWEFRRRDYHEPMSKTQCSECKQDVCIETANLERCTVDKFKIICTECALTLMSKLDDTFSFCGAMRKGKTEEDGYS